MLFSFLYSLFSQSSYLKEKFTIITKVTIFLLSATSFSVFYKQPKNTAARQQELNGNNLRYERKEDNKTVNILRKRKFRLTHYLSVHCKTYYFAFQKRRFYTIKAAVLRCKTAAFAMPKRSCQFLTELFLQNQRSANALFSFSSIISRSPGPLSFMPQRWSTP